MRAAKGWAFFHGPAAWAIYAIVLFWPLFGYRHGLPSTLHINCVTVQGTYHHIYRTQVDIFASIGTVFGVATAACCRSTAATTTFAGWPVDQTMQVA